MNDVTKIDEGRPHVGGQELDQRTKIDSSKTDTFFAGYKHSAWACAQKLGGKDGQNVEVE